MKIQTFLILWTLSLSQLLSQDPARNAWKHFSIDPVLPGSSWGTGGPALADYDRDGDVDIVSKIWNADGPSYHLDFWRNELIK